MYPVSQKCLEAFSNYKRDLRFIITVDNSEINETDVMEFEINEGLMQSENFQLGGCVSTTISMKINNLHGMYSVEMLRGKKIEVTIGIVTTDSIEYVPMGVFIVDEVVDDKSFIKIEGLDNMIKFEKDYESKLKYPTTAKAMLQEMCSLCGVDLDTNSFKNENYIIDKPIDQERCRNILHDIAILAGGFAKINRNGKLELKTISDSGIEINKDNYITLNVKEKFFIDKFVVTETYFPIDAIPFNLEVIPFTSKWNGNPALDVGDTVKLNDDKSTVKSIVTKQKIKFSGGLTYESECSGLSEQQQQTQLVNQKQVNRKFASEIKQNAEEISMRVKNDELETIVTQNADSWGLSINGKLKNVNCLFNDEGMNIYNGSLKIYDKSIDTEDKKVVFGADNTGTLIFSGIFQQTDANGNKSIEIKNNAVKIYNWKQKGDYIGSLGSLVRQDDSGDKALIGLWNDTDSALSINYQSDTESNSKPAYMYFDKYNVLGDNTDYPIIFNLPTRFKNNVRLTRIKFSDTNNTLYINGYDGSTKDISIGADTIYMFGKLHVNENLSVVGDLTVGGNKNCVQKTQNYGTRLFYSVEDAQSFLTYTGRQECTVEKVEDRYERKIYLDEIFKECVNLKENYNVEIYKIGWGDYRIKEKTEDYFILESDREDFVFNYCIKAKRKGYEDKNMDKFEMEVIEENEGL